MSLWLGFSGRAEKIDYEFEDICPHGPDRRKAVCWKLLNTTAMSRGLTVLGFLNILNCCWRFFYFFYFIRCIHMYVDAFSQVQAEATRFLSPVNADIFLTWSTLRVCSPFPA